LDLAKTSTTPVDKILSLRGYLGMANRPEVAAPAKLAIYREAAALIQRDDERLLLLGGLAKLADPAGIDLAAAYLDQPGVKTEAVAAVIAMAEKRAANQHVAPTRSALEKVTQVASDNPAMVAKAKDLIQKMAAEK
jgi:hypothetical protein